MRTRVRRPGFTLVELLVVIGIIALLIAILLPSLSKARKQALSVSCSSNLRQMGQALVFYTNEYKHFPACQVLRGGTAYAVWPSRLRKALGMGPSNGNNIFWCPAQEAGFQWQQRTGTGAGYAADSDSGYGYEPGEFMLNVFTVPFSYGYNDWGGGNAQGPSVAVDRQYGLGGDITDAAGAARELKASRVKVASEMIAIADNTADGVWDYNIDPFNKNEYPGKIHNNGANVLFCDGHVEWFAQGTLVEFASPQTYPVARMWNNDHKIHLKNGTIID